MPANRAFISVHEFWQLAYDTVFSKSRKGKFSHFLDFFLRLPYKLNKNNSMVVYRSSVEFEVLNKHSHEKIHNSRRNGSTYLSFASIQGFGL